jgi:hypothetical protein
MERFMKLRAALVLAAVLTFPIGASAQEAAIKAGFSISSFQTDGDIGYTDRLVSTTFGGHYRRFFGPIALQGEVNMVTRGGKTDDGTETLRLQYLELPLLLVVPVNVSSFQAYAFGGPMLSLETRCRYIFKEEGLKTNFGCDVSTSAVFDRRPLDYAITGGLGLSHPLASGRIMLEARQTFGMRNIYDGPDPIEVKNRTFMVNLGYTLELDPDARRSRR